MKIDFVLTACNLSDHYLSLYPYVVKVWKDKFNLDCYLILIAKEIPTNLKVYAKNIILFDPIPGINEIFIAQVIRILYPALFENKNILTTDVDILPISYNYFITSVKDISDDAFITYRDFYLGQQMLSICYNLANSTTWEEIFKIKTKEDLIEIIKMWYNPAYTGVKNCPGWFTDQQQLYKYVMQWNINTNLLHILHDKNLKFKRLDKRNKQYIVSNFKEVTNNIKKGIYVDYHSIKPMCRYKKLTREIANAILNSGK